jgi:hypothetical protein
MTRAALLPAGADPFLNAYWLRHFERWADEVDELRMMVCGADARTKKYLRSIAGPKVILTFSERIDHGLAIRTLIEATSADLVMLCEDDAFVRRHGAVSEAFGWIEAGGWDIVACPRASMTQDLREVAASRFGWLDSSSGEGGPAFWPCFFFGRREDLLATDRHFGAAAWQPGDTIPGLDYTANAETAADTFSGTSFQLRKAGLRVKVMPQYRANLSKMVDWVHEDIPWFHVGSLSSGFGYYFLAGLTPEDEERHAQSIRNDLFDWNKRMAWWEKVSETTDLPKLGAEYREALAQFKSRTGMRASDVEPWRHLFDRLTAWT